jgi:acylphosphatase
LESIPKRDERIFLRRISNLSRGGESVDITDKLTPEQKDIAARAAKAIPGLVQCGVDMIINEETGSGVILELNTRPGIGNHLFPVEGRARDIPKEIVDYYIPESRGIETTDSNTYFEFKHIIETLKGKAVKEIELRPYPGKLISKYINIDGISTISNIYSKIEKLAFNKEIHGYLKLTDSDSATLIVGGCTEDMLNDFMRDLQEIADHHRLTLSGKENMGVPILCGFRLLDSADEMSLRKMKAAVKDLKEKRSLVEKEKIRITKRMNLIQQSVSWKLSTPIRTLTRKIKKVGKN